MSVALHGICASKGIAVGRVYIADPGQLEIHEYTIWPRQVDGEVARFEAAVDVAREELRAIKRQIPQETSEDVAAFIDTYLLMLEDSVITTAPIKSIREQRCNAEWALKTERDKLVSVFESMEDPYLRTRKDDIDHVVNRIQRILINQGKPEQDASDGRLAGKVVFADDLSPADTVLMQHQGVAGLLTEFGGTNSHTAILARSLRLPAVVGLHHARRYLRDNEMVVIDGREGVVVVDPDEGSVRHFRRRQRDIERHHVVRRSLRRAPAATCDGERIGLRANVELPSDVHAAVQVGAEGIGLYRTEFLFMNREQPPSEEEQYDSYMRLVKSARGGPVTIRTLDLGADKQVDGGRCGAPVPTNPALGLRAVRLCLKEQALFRPQLRAILRASGRGPVRMLIPMLSNTLELRQVLQVVADCRRERRVSAQRTGRTNPQPAATAVERRLS